MKQGSGRFVWKRNAFCIKTGDVLYGNEMRFVSKRLPFWVKTHPILGQNASRFGPKRRAYCFDTNRILLYLCATAHAQMQLIEGRQQDEKREDDGHDDGSRAVAQHIGKLDIGVGIEL